MIDLNLPEVWHNKKNISNKLRESTYTDGKKLNEILGIFCEETIEYFYLKFNSILFLSCNTKKKLLQNYYK